MKNNNLHLFNSNLNNKYKSIPFNIRSSDSGEIKYLPPVSKEWKNTIYSYYKNNMQNLPINNINANKIIRSYFNLYFKNNKFIDSKYIGRRKRRNFLRKIYASKIETKHTNSKIIITLYTMNIGKNILQKNYKYFYKYFNNKILNFWKHKLNDKIKRINLFMKEKEGRNKQSYLSNTTNKNNLVLLKYKTLENKKKLFVFKYKLLSESLKWYNLYLKLYLSRAIRFSYYNKLKLLRKHQFNYYLNRFKFEKGVFLPKLNNILSKIFNNNIEFNIINLKSLTFNTDIFTEALALKIRRKKSNVTRGINSILKRASLPKVNRIIEKSSFIKNKNRLLIENRYKNLSLLSILNKNNSLEQDNTCSLNKLLKETTNYTSESFVSKSNLNDIANKDYVNISNLIFNSIKYKNMGGIRLEVKGRLTKRYRADRSIYKLKWKGGLKNIDSSYKRLSTVAYRGYYKPNIIYSLSTSKRRIGAFAVKGWVSGK